MNLNLSKLLLSLCLLTACTKTEILPEKEILLQESDGIQNPAGNLGGSINLRGKINQNILRDNPKLTYIVSGNKYYFTCIYPKINDPNPGDYYWVCKWSYKLSKLGGVKFYHYQYLPPLIPVDFLSCGIEVYCVNKITGVKSGTKSTLLIVKL